MILTKLIEKFKEQASICANTYYANKERVKVYKLALDKTLIFFDTIKKGFGQNGIEEFSSLLSLEEDNLRFWAAALFISRVNIAAIVSNVNAVFIL